MGITIAIDGPAGAGKSTVARAVARELDYTLVDTGAIYRAVALLARRRGVAWDDPKGLEGLVAELDIDFHFEDDVNHVRVAGEDVTDAIRTGEISMGASEVSAVPEVRAGLLDLQRRLAGKGGAVLEGRDIGTVVFPEAELKVYLDAAPEERARRRLEELSARGDDAEYERVLAEVRQRDAQDQGRDIAPLEAADDALVLDSTKLGADDVIARIVGAAREATVKAGAN